jgi:hypothetical protein
MGFNIIEIATAWIIANNPTPEQKELAEKRYSVCLSCTYRKTRMITHDEFCGDCGCPLSKKIFSDKFDACTQHKWLDVESEYVDVLKDFNKNPQSAMQLKEQKSKKTII